MTDMLDPNSSTLNATDVAALNTLADNLETHKAKLLWLDRHTKRLKIATLIIGCVGAVAIWVGIIGAQALASTNADRASRTQTSCVASNVKDAQVQVTLKNLVLAFVPAPADFTLEQKINALSPSQREAYDRIAKAIEEGLKFRDCSDEGIKKYFEQELIDPGAN